MEFSISDKLRFQRLVVELRSKCLILGEDAAIEQFVNARICECWPDGFVSPNYRADVLSYTISVLRNDIESASRFGTFINCGNETEYYRRQYEAKLSPQSKDSLRREFRRISSLSREERTKECERYAKLAENAVYDSGHYNFCLCIATYAKYWY